MYLIAGVILENIAVIILGFKCNIFFPQSVPGFPGFHDHSQIWCPPRTPGHPHEPKFDCSLSTHR